MCFFKTAIFRNRCFTALMESSNPLDRETAAFVRIVSSSKSLVDVLANYMQNILMISQAGHENGETGRSKTKEKPFHRYNLQNDFPMLNNSHMRDILPLCVTQHAHGGMAMAVSYKRLFHLLIEKGVTTAQLQHQAGFSANIITRMKRNGYLSLDTIESICRTLNCGVDDILEFIDESEKII